MDDLLTFGGVVLVVWGIPYTTRQIRMQHDQLRDAVDAQRAELVRDLYSRLYSDGDIRQVYHIIEYGELLDSDLSDPIAEQRLDKLLTFADMVCAVLAMGRITPQDMQLFDYEFSRIVANSTVRRYMAGLTGHYRRTGIQRPAFGDLVEYCTNKGFLGGEPQWKPKWEAAWLQPNLRVWEERLEARLGRSRAEYLTDVIRLVLDDRLSRLAYGVGDGLGFYIDLVVGLDALPKTSQHHSALRVVPAFLSWDYGTDALRSGSTILGWNHIAELSETDPAAAVEVTWLAGILQLAFPQQQEHALAPSMWLLDPVAEIQRLRDVFTETAQSTLGVSPPHIQYPHTLRLWQNAVAIAMVRHRERALQGDEGLPEDWDAWRAVLVDMLNATGTTDAWPLQLHANIKFQHKHRKAKWFWDPPTWPAENRNGYTVRVLYPLEVLNSGNVFNTCLRLRGESTAGIVGWAVDSNVRVIGVVQSDGRVLARRTVWLNTVRHQYSVVTGPCYPEDSPYTYEIGQFIKGRIPSSIKVEEGSKARLCGLCTSTYNDEWL